MANNIKNLSSLENIDVLNTFELGCYEKDVYIRDGDQFYNVDQPGNYQRIQFKKTLSTHGLHIPPNLNQVVYVTRTGTSEAYTRTTPGIPLTFDRFSDETSTNYIMPQDMINILINENYADFFRNDPNGNAPYNGTEKRAYWWFMIYDINDEVHERFCFLPYKTPMDTNPNAFRWNSINDLLTEYIAKVKDTAATQNIQNFDLTFGELGMEMSLKPTQMLPLEINMIAPSYIQFWTVGGAPTSVVTTSMLKAKDTALPLEENYNYSKNVEKRLHYFVFEGKNSFEKIPIDADNNGNYADGPEDQTGANFYYFGETEKIHIMCEEKKLTYIITIYGLPRKLNRYGFYEYMFLIERFEDLIVPQESFLEVE
jgi:hypothetical protein